MGGGILDGLVTCIVSRNNHTSDTFNEDREAFIGNSIKSNCVLFIRKSIIILYKLGIAIYKNN